MTKLVYEIKTQWDSDPIDHAPVTITLSAGADNGVLMEVSAPYFGDPAPPSTPGQSLWGLWEYEVIEMFFLAKEGHNYFEIELGPHGQHLALVLDGYRQPFKQELPLDGYQAEIKGSRWTGRVNIPLEYFPPKVDRMNAYALHGVEGADYKPQAPSEGDFFRSSRVYEALYPAPKGKHTEPEHHRIEYFQPIDFESICPENWSRPPSDLWKDKF